MTHHVVPKWQLIKCLYDNLSEPHRQMVNALCNGTFITKNEDKTRELFNTEWQFHAHASISRSDRVTPTIIQKKNDVYKSGHSVDIHKKVDLLTQKLDQVLCVGRGQVPTFTPPTPLEVCSPCSNLTHYLSDCPMVAQYPEFVQEQVQVIQVSLGQPTIHSPTHTILAGGIISIFLETDPNHHPKTFLNYLGLHIRPKLNPTSTQRWKHQPLPSRIHLL